MQRSLGVTASKSKNPAETTIAQTDVPQSVNAGDYASADYTPHATQSETLKASDNAAPVSPPKDETRKGVPAFIMGMIGGMSMGVIGVLLVLIFNPLLDITERLSAVETNVAGAATRRAMETNDKRLVAVETRFESLRSEIDALSRNPITGPVDLNGIKTHLAQTDQILSSLQQELGKSKTPVSVALAQDAARLTLALIITDKLEQGQAIQSELQIIEPLITDPAQLASLKPWAEGHAAQAVLVQEFSRLYPILVKAIPAPENEALHQMLLRHFKQWIHWRRIDQNDSSDPEGLLLRINLNLQKGLNGEALKLIRTLPAPMQSPSKTIERMITQRIEALKAGELLLNTAMAQLAQSAQSKGNQP